MKGIEIKNITKKYKDVVALNDVSFNFDAGKIYGFLGRNGAGKSTLINIISSRIFANSGEVFIDGIKATDNMDVHEKIFCMTEVDLYPNSIKLKELFKWIDRFYSCFNIDMAFEIAKKFNLNTDKRLKQLSKGYQSIFKLTVALALDVPYIIYDEPVLGLDANHRELFYRLLLEDAQDNDKTIIIATHLIEEVATLVEEVVMINEGRVLINESVETLLSRGYSITGMQNDVDNYCKDKNVIGYDELGSMKVCYILGEKTDIPKDSSMQISAINLQKLFIQLTEKGSN